MSSSRIRDWLLDSGVQIGCGRARGAVAGWLDERGLPAFAYPEATGYYLTWLAFLAASDPGACDGAPRARLALAWIAGAFQRSQPPPTRIYLDGSVDDWRNRAWFSFDLAMLARGVASARGLTGAGADAVLQRVVATLQCFRSSAGLRPVAPASARSSLPRRWSTRAGPHLTKAAAAILVLPQERVPADLRHAAERTLRRWRDRPAAARREMHALFYCAEGLVLEAMRRDDPLAWSRAAAIAGRLSDRAPEERPDVLAQALRLGCVLFDRGLLPGGGARAHLATLACALRRSVSSDGSIVFFPEGREGPHLNAWAAMFAHQALTFHEALEAGGRLPERWLEFLV